MEDNKINSAPDLSLDFRPSGDTAGPGSPGNGSPLKSGARCAKHEPPMPNLSAIRGHAVTLGAGRKTN